MTKFDRAYNEGLVFLREQYGIYGCPDTLEYQNMLDELDLNMTIAFGDIWKDIPDFEFWEKVINDAVTASEIDEIIKDMGACDTITRTDYKSLYGIAMTKLLYLI